MVQSYAVAYAVAWTLTTVLTLATGRHLTMLSDGPAHPVLTSIFAGAVWPIVILGLIEASVLGVIESVQSYRRPSPTVPREAAEVVRLP